MSVSPKSFLLTTSLAFAFAAPCMFAAGDAEAQPGNAPLTMYPACTNKPTAQDSDAAHSAYLLGKRFFEESDYGSASHNFTDAYKLDCTKPELLLNIARANELLGNRAEAVHALETYMQRGTSLTADDKTQLQRRIDNLKAALAQATVATPIVVTPPPTTAPPVVIAPSPEPPAPPPTPVEERSHTVTPWIIVGIGVAAVATGGVVWLVGNSDVSDAEKTCPNGVCASKTPATEAAISKGQDGGNLKDAGAVVFYSGLAVTAGGLLWHFLEPTGPVKSDASKLSFTPVFAPGYTGANVVGSF